MGFNISKNERFIETAYSTLTNFWEAGTILPIKGQKKSSDKFGGSNLSPDTEAKLFPFASAKCHSLLQEAADSRTKLFC